LKNIGLILFDIDGVIRSVENSYRLSLKKTVYKFSGWEPSYVDIDNAKNEGIWNNDWDLSLEFIKRFKKKENLNFEIPSREDIVKCFEEFYFGGDPNEDSKYWTGFITNEELLVNKEFFDLLETVGLTPGEKFSEKFPHEMSGGERQRVAIARALSLDPKIIVADEPTSMLDVSIRMDVLQIFAKMRKNKNLTVLFITHDLASARYLADRIIVLKNGSIVEENKSEDLIQNPSEKYTKQLIEAASPGWLKSINKGFEE